MDQKTSNNNACTSLIHKHRRFISLNKKIYTQPDTRTRYSAFTRLHGNPVPTVPLMNYIFHDAENFILKRYE